VSLCSLQPQESGREVEAEKAEVGMVVVEMVGAMVEVVGAMVEVVAPVMEAWEN